jgi:hypothetical protein
MSFIYTVKQYVQYSSHHIHLMCIFLRRHIYKYVSVYYSPAFFIATSCNYIRLLLSVTAISLCTPKPSALHYICCPTPTPHFIESVFQPPVCDIHRYPQHTHTRHSWNWVLGFRLRIIFCIPQTAANSAAIGGFK